METEKQEKNWSLRLAIALPFVMIAFVVASIYLPRLWAPAPKYDFVYHDGQDYGSAVTFRVIDGALIKEEVKRIEGVYYTEPHLYLYDIATDNSRRVSFEEARDLKLDGSRVSPDGFSIESGIESRGDFSGSFGGYPKPLVYLKGHMVSRKLHGGFDAEDSNSGFQFIGWVVK